MDILKEVEQFAQVDPTDVPKGSRYLLESDVSAFQDTSLEDQSYWLFSAQASCIAGKRVVRRRSVARAGARCGRERCQN